jgi:hypothetical protein
MMKRCRFGSADASPSNRPTDWFACSSSFWRPSRRRGGTGGNGGGTKARTVSSPNVVEMYRPSLWSRFSVKSENPFVKKSLTKGYCTSLLLLQLASQTKNAQENSEIAILLSVTQPNTA